MKSLTISIILVLMLGAGVCAREPEDDLKNTKHQIHILNLLNGLELSQEQMRLILDAAYTAKDTHLKAEQKITYTEKETASAYDKVLSVAKAGSLVIPEDIASGVHRVNRGLDEAKKTAQEELTSLITKIKDNLEPHQVYTLQNYKPCIIPPVKEGRIGQADSSAGLSKMLERVRSLPANRYYVVREEIAQRQIDRAKAKVPAGFIVDEEKLKTQLLKAMDEVRTVSDVDFALKKEEIAQNIKNQLAPERPPMDIGIKIGRFLLSPEIIPILEQRLASSRSS